MKRTIFSDQMFGSGKTYFGRNLISKAKYLRKNIENEIENLVKMSPNFFDTFKEWYPNILERILNCTTKTFVYNQNTFRNIESMIQINKKQDYFIHIDELSDDEDQVRKLWISLNEKQNELIGKDIIITFYLSGKNTLMNKVNYYY